MVTEIYDVKHFLARNGIPYQWLDMEASEEAHQLVSYFESTRKDGHSGYSPTVSTTAISSSSFSILGNNTKTDNNDSSESSIRLESSPLYLSSLNLPLVIFPDGSYMEEPSNSDENKCSHIRTN